MNAVTGCDHTSECDNTPMTFSDGICVRRSTCISIGKDDEVSVGDGEGKHNNWLEVFIILPTNAI